MKFLLHLYPRQWRERYGEEMRDYLEQEPASFRTGLDLLAGAVDAWRNRSLVTSGSLIDGKRCGSTDISRKEAWYSAGLMIAVCLLLTAIAIVLDKRYGDHIMIDALINSAFFIGLTVSSNSTFLKPYSAVARRVIIGVSIVGWYLFFLGVSYLGTMI